MVNGDVISWRAFWPKLAAHLGVRPGAVRPFRMSAWVRDKAPAWRQIVHQYGLRGTELDEVADWAFADFHWAQGYDVCSSMAKLHAAGFPESLDSEAMFLHHLDRYREAKILP